MISFREITLNDKETITRYTLNSTRQSCDFSFSNLCSWQFLYGTKFAIYHDFLFLKFSIESTPFYMLPIGDGELQEAIEILKKDAKDEGTTLRIAGVDNETCNKLKHLFPEQIIFTTNRNYTDYLYLRHDLASLNGKKLQPKRNHINKFKRLYPNYEYLPITSENIADCIRLEAEWCKANNCQQNEGTGNEQRAVLYALHHFNALGLSGGLLQINKRIVAFTFGMPINRQTFGIHVEKADITTEGAYAMINQEFAKHIPEQYTYINREEDLGLEGLRKAKLSYQPVLLLDKYIATWK